MEESVEPVAAYLPSELNVAQMQDSLWVALNMVVKLGTGLTREDQGAFKTRVCVPVVGSEVSSKSRCWEVVVAATQPQCFNCCKSITSIP